MSPRHLAVAAVFASGCTGEASDTPLPAGSTAATSVAETTSGDPTSSNADTTSSSTGSTGDAPEGWTVVSELGPDLGMAMSVWGRTAEEALVVGGQLSSDDGSTGFVLRRTSGGWEPDPLPQGTPMLHWVGPAGEDTWLVGREGAALRWEEKAWVSHPSNTEVDLWGVWGGTSDDVWAVGGDGIADPPTLLHFDGSVWGPSELPADLPRGSNALFKVWGADAEHVFIVGDSGVALDGVGPDWGATYSESIAPWVAVRGRSATDVVAVGGRSNARIARFDGSTWQDTTLLDAGLNGVWLDSSGRATLVGRLGGIFELPAGSMEPVAMSSPTLDLLHAVHGFEDGTRIVVGGSFEGPPPWRGVILEHAG